MRTVTGMLLLVWAIWVVAADKAVALRLVDIEGAPIEGRVTVLQPTTATLETRRGTVRLPLPGEDALLKVRVSAPGYYDAVHTFARADLVSAPPGIRLVKRAKGRVMLTFAGDTMAARRYLHPRDGEAALLSDPPAVQEMLGLLEHVAPYLDLADVTSVNLETPLSVDDPGGRLRKSVTFYSHPSLITALQQAGVDYVALGNNHIYDFAETGLRRTLSLLEQSTLGFSGAGLDAQSARAAWLHAPGNLAFLSYVGWPGTFSPTQTATATKGGAALGTARTLREDAARYPERVTVVNYHGGLEYSSAPSLMDLNRMHAAVDAGADVVIGHHPHVVQGLELKDQRLIAYSLGNFLFDQYIYATHAGMLLHVWLDGEEMYAAEVVPLHINGYVPQPATGTFARSILRQIRAQSAPTLVGRASGAHGLFRAPELLQSVVEAVPIRSAGVVALPAWDADYELDLTESGLFLRQGTELLRRGDLSYLERAPLRDWLNVREAQVVRGEDGVRLMFTGPVSTGMKVFERVFTPSAPQTLMLRVETDSAVRVRAYLQRRRTDQSLAQALEAGPSELLGERLVRAGKEQVLRFDFNSPRLASRGLRLLLDIQQAEQARTWIDDIAWIDWRSPWRRTGAGGSEIRLTDASTHLEVRHTMPGEGQVQE